MIAWVVPYVDKYGEHTLTKWANSAKEARDLVIKSRGGWGLNTEVGCPVPVDPQPFSEESRAKHSVQ